MSAAELVGISHVALNVTDLDRSLRWYVEVLDFVPVFPFNTEAFDRQILLHPTGFAVALSRHHHPDADAAFSERRPGLDHLAFAVRDSAALEAWVTRLDAAGVEHSGVSSTPLTGSELISFRDPDGIALELYVQVAPPA